MYEALRWHSALPPSEQAAVEASCLWCDEVDIDEWNRRTLCYEVDADEKQAILLVEHELISVQRDWTMLEYDEYLAIELGFIE